MGAGDKMENAAEELGGKAKETVGKMTDDGARVLVDGAHQTLTSAGCLRANHSRATIANRNGVIER